MFEIFDPTDGIPLYRVKHQWLAKLIARIAKLDWAREGEGW